MKRSQLKRKGGRLFPQSPEDKAYWDWFRRDRRPCDVCGYTTASAAHLTKRGSGGKDRNNLVWLCEGHSVASPAQHVTDHGESWTQGCHWLQEGRTDAFILECNKDLWAIARAHTARFDREGEV